MKLDIFSRRQGKAQPSSRSLDPDLNVNDCIDLTSGLSPCVASSSDDGDPPRQNFLTHNDAGESREQRVARLRQQVRSGTYEIPVAQLVKVLADLILRRR